MKNYYVGRVVIILAATVIVTTGENFDREPLYPRDCLLPAKQGNLADADGTPTYFFYKDLGTCLEFMHVGGEANPNNFKSFSACMYTCETHVHKCMYDKKDPGPCKNV